MRMALQLVTFNTGGKPQTDNQARYSQALLAKDSGVQMLTAARLNSLKSLTCQEIMYCWK